MTDLKHAFLARLAGIHFAGRFYALVAETAGQTPLVGLTSPASALAATGHEFIHVNAGNFWKMAPRQAADRFALHLAIARGRVEPILNLVAADGTSLGGPYSGLAADVARLADPGFRHDPPYPKIIYTTEAGLTRLATALIALAYDVREAAG